MAEYTTTVETPTSKGQWQQDDRVLMPRRMVEGEWQFANADYVNDLEAERDGLLVDLKDTVRIASEQITLARRAYARLEAENVRLDGMLVRGYD